MELPFSARQGHPEFGVILFEKNPPEWNRVRPISYKKAKRLTKDFTRFEGLFLGVHIKVVYRFVPGWKVLEREDLPAEEGNNSPDNA